MNSKAVRQTLVFVLFLSSLVTAALATWYVFSIRQINSQQPQLVQLNNNRMLAQALAADAIEYSKRNPAIHPVLQSLNLLPRPVASAPANPSTPAGK